MVATKAAAIPWPSFDGSFRFCITAMSPMTAPMMPNVGEYTPMASKTLAACVSKCSMVSNSISMLERIASGSPPSTRDCNPFFRNASFSVSTADSRPSRPCLRAILLRSTIFSIIAAGLFTGGLNTQETIFHARKNVVSGVCTKLAANVPSTTMTKAALPTRGPALLPLRIAPPMIAISARMMPMMLRISIGSIRPQPLREACAQPYQRLAVDLTHSRFGHLEHLAYFAQVHVLIVVQRQHQFFPLGQLIDRGRERIAKSGVFDMIERPGP